jgi:inner membrane protein
VDNLTHSLVGWALGEAGFKRKTGLAVATLVIAANLPDVDVLGLPFGENLAFRRGITHGPLAWAVMAPGLAAAMLAFDRWQARRGTRPAARPPVHFGWLLLISLVGVLSHPALDWLNVYGIRCLMPFSETWFYGDTLFIIDVWVWLALGIGIAFARRRGSVRPARAALAAVVGYIALMWTGGQWAEWAGARAVVAAGLGTPVEVVASPPPLDPFARQIIYDLDDRVGYGMARLLPPTLTIEPPFATGMADPAVALAARQHKAVADFLSWSRLPMATVTRADGLARVAITDARFARPLRLRTFVVEAEVAE